jgi:hypothetical protein
MKPVKLKRTAAADVRRRMAVRLPGVRLLTSAAAEMV